MKHLQLFEEFNSSNTDHLNEDITSLLRKAKSGFLTTAIITALLASPDVTAQDKKDIAQKAENMDQGDTESSGSGVCISTDEAESKRIALSHAIVNISKCIPPGTDLIYEKVEEITLKLEDGRYQTTITIKTNPAGTKVTKGELDSHKRISARDYAKVQREIRVDKMRKDVEERAKKLGFKTVEEYYAWQEERNKGEDQPLDGLMDPSFKSTKCGISKAGAKDAKKEWSKK